MHRFTLPITEMHLAEGWTMRRLSSGGLELRDPGGSVFSRFMCDVPEPWISAAARYGLVLVLYGVGIGVRTPPDTSPDRYTASMRAAELKESCKRGIVAVGYVRWS
jgi:hypothetical protein